jgi:AcrR family transcriptional regulator
LTIDRTQCENGVMDKPRRIVSNGEPPLGRRERKALATRRALIEAGLRAFERHPIEMVAVLDITDAADAAKGVFYLHFDSKDDYVLAICAEVYRALINDIRIEGGAIAKASARLEAVVDAYARLSESNLPAVIFLCRMNSYLADEIGPPGRLITLRSDFLRDLAGILAGRAQRNVSAASWRRARLVDGICMCMLWQAKRVAESLPSRQELLQVVTAAVEAASR